MQSVNQTESPRRLPINALCLALFVALSPFSVGRASPRAPDNSETNHSSTARGATRTGQDARPTQPRSSEGFLTQPLSLADAVNVALTQNPDIRRAQKDLEASQLAYTNALDAYRLALSNAEINRSGVNPNSQSIAVAKIKQAQEQLANLQVQVSRGTVRAPITGIVTDQFQFDGEFAQSGAKLVTIADISTVIVKAQFADTVVHDLKVGDAVTVYPMEAQDEKLTGSVTLISRSSDPQNRTVEVWARFGNPQGLLPANGAVQFVVESQPVEDAIVVPSSAVTLEATNADEGTVMVVGPDNIAHETKVKVGVKQGDKTQIVEGLNGGETVVTDGNYELPDGTRVEVATEKQDDEEDEK